MGNHSSNPPLFSAGAAVQAAGMMMSAAMSRGNNAANSRFVQSGCLFHMLLTHTLSNDDSILGSEVLTAIQEVIVVGDTR
mgnify:CR=1 FL=1